MEKPREFEKPMGFRDLPPKLAARKRQFEERVHARFSAWGYEEVCTPTLEFFETVGRASAISESRMFKCLDREGHALVLCPDQTAPIARMAASLLKDEPLPLRLCYHARVFRAQEVEAGRQAEWFQSGVELVGLEGPAADAEVMALALDCMRACEVEDFQLAFGHTALLDGFLRERISDESVLEQLKEKLGERDLVGFQEIVNNSPLPQQAKQEILFLLHVDKGSEGMKELAKRTRSETVLQAVAYLEACRACLEAYGFGECLVFDPCLVGNLGYYSGVYFEGMGSGQAFPLFSGGRYDRLYERFSKPMPATGFAITLDRLMASGKLEVPETKCVGVLYPPAAMRPAMALAEKLRNEGNRVIAEVWQSERDEERMQRKAEQVLLLDEKGGVRRVDDCSA
ncbi:ATP phosphoribosyltransferase regulatory subunit [Laceyella sacchari]|uniref:ATP phosphoribosyltransferase regulatory subunit n=1 Tax=Laceyella sacchari TaxID=37482 RepID=A0ABY5U1D9_LACSH|nr:ATP phosphoribosyltransferase regulatory subunit [Laceyella sacchari]UWE03444.1 ATP phosphoribosyltransferase regulatory subunit [Laceyella sacchari]